MMIMIATVFGNTKTQQSDEEESSNETPAIPVEPSELCWAVQVALRAAALWDSAQLWQKKTRQSSNSSVTFAPALKKIKKRERKKNHSVSPQ